MAATSTNRDHVSTYLEGDDCNYCERGELVDGTYKGGPAIVCDTCDVPQVRFF